MDKDTEVEVIERMRELWRHPMCHNQPNQCDWDEALRAFIHNLLMPTLPNRILARRIERDEA
jgi:hypothetical protein